MSDPVPANPRSLGDHAATAEMLGLDAVMVRPADNAAAVEGGDTSHAGSPPGVRSAARSATSNRAERMAALRERYEHEAPHASFNTSFKNIVWGDGSVDAPLMFVGEAPGRDEDEQGVPFVGRAGQLLNKMIEAMGLARGEKAPPGRGVYIANVLKTRPPNNATPTTQEARACAPFLFEQISIVAPRVIVTLGLPATHLLLDTSEAMGRLRGRWASFHDEHTGRDIPVMPTYHPAYLLRSYTPENRKKVWSDLQLAMEKLA